MTEARLLTFTAPGKVEIHSEILAPPGPGQALVQNLVSGISAGTELLILHGEAPPGIDADLHLPALGGNLDFPVRYGYCCVGRVLALGPGTDASLQGRRVFAFVPHATHFIAPADSLVRLPTDLPEEAGVFLPNLETAVGLIHDGAPRLGERVAVFGQGIVGLLATALLHRCSLERLATFDRFALRRQASLDLGAGVSLDPTADPIDGWLPDPSEPGLGPPGADLAFELTGDPRALDQALSVCGFHGRVVVGSWYGTRRASLDLGGRFHRSRIRLISSQVSTIDPSLSGRWDRARRLHLVLDRLRQLPTERLISHRIPFDRAPDAYALLERHPEQTLQVVLTYDAGGG